MSEETVQPPVMSENAPEPEAVTGNDSPPQAKPEPRRKQFKVNGEVMDMSEEEADRFAQMGLGAHKKFQEAATLRKEASAIMDRFEKDPKGALRELKSKNPKLREALEEILWEDIQEQQMSPEQKKQRERDERLKKYEEKEEDDKVSAQKAEDQQLQDRYQKEYTESFSAAIQKVGLPNTPQALARLANYMSQALEAGMDLDAADAATLVRNDYMAELKALVGSHADPASLLGEEITGKLRKSDLAKIRSPQAARATENAPREAKAPEDKHISSEDFKEAIRKKLENMG